MARTRRPKQTAADVLHKLARKISSDIHSIDKDSGRGAGVRHYAQMAHVSEATVRRFLEQAQGAHRAVHFETAFKLAQVVFHELRLVRQPLY